MSTQPSQGKLAVVSPTEIVFPVQADKEVTCDLYIDNVTSSPVAYKVKTTAPDKYQVRPIQATIPPLGRATCRIVMKKVSVLPDFADPKQTKHKFQVQIADYPDGSPDDLVRPPGQHMLTATTSRHR